MTVVLLLIEIFVFLVTCTFKLKTKTMTHLARVLDYNALLPEELFSSNFLNELIMVNTFAKKINEHPNKKAPSITNFLIHLTLIAEAVSTLTCPFVMV